MISTKLLLQSLPVDQAEKNESDEREGGRRSERSKSDITSPRRVAWCRVTTRRDFKRRTGARRGAALLRHAVRRGGRGVVPRAWEPVTNRAIRFERVAVTSTPVTGGNWASRGRGVVARGGGIQRHSGRDGTPETLLGAVSTPLTAVCL
ncbi:PREDICTED: uncharacterized protein LOC108757467 [Trachymyrmex cornetzi]|uniref:uncharacterized protein LOC108757467 n=1 Tax=Trachymyrmex cornetzi TaxID=471704 RepID=UPI00084F7F16|nr:PREDICTED: uncharacterized protein LOC108757467 [Trachymyrmex cornetzi]